MDYQKSFRAGYYSFFIVYIIWQGKLCDRRELEVTRYSFYFYYLFKKKKKKKKK